METTQKEYTLPLAFADCVWRSVTPDDYPALVELIRAVDVHSGNTNYEMTVEELKYEYEDPKFDMALSTRAVFDPSGRALALADVYDGAAVPVRIFMAWWVAPDAQNQGLEELLLAWVDERVQLTLQRCPDDTRVVIHTGMLKGYLPKAQAYEKAGYQHVRNFYRMRINMDAPPPTPMLPDGITIHTYRHTDDLQRYVEARLDGFRDHWGFVAQPLDKAMEMTLEWYNDDPKFDASLCFLAVNDATGEVAGASMCRIEEMGDPAVGYVMTLFTRRAYRGQGLALALLHHTFGEFWKRDRKSVALHVDASSLTGAVRLYEKAGMFQEIVEVTYEKVVRDGKNLMTMELDK